MFHTHKILHNLNKNTPETTFNKNYQNSQVYLLFLLLGGKGQDKAALIKSLI